MEEILLLKAKDRQFPGFGQEQNGDWTGPFCFIQGADTQLGMIEGYIEKKADPGWQKDLELTEKAILCANALTPKPRFFIVCGDLIHAFPGASDRAAQESDFIRAFARLNPSVPLVCVCGNHDVGNTPTHQTVQEYRERFGDDCFSFFVCGVMFIVLNSQLFKDPSEVEDLAAEQELWLDAQLELAKSGKFKHVIVFQHISPFLTDPDEEENYFNLSLDAREKLLKKLHDANVKAVFCGHWHGNAGGFYKDLEVVVTSAIGGQLRNDVSGFRIVTLTESAVKHQYYDLDNVPKTITLE